MRTNAREDAPTSPPTSHLGSSRPMLGWIRLAWAGILLAAPAAVVGVIGGPVNPTSVTVARILGARHAVQGLVEVGAWPRLRRAGALVDAAHSLTAAGLAVSADRWRRVGMTDCVVAGAFAIAGWTQSPPRSPAIYSAVAWQNPVVEERVQN